MLCNKCGNDFSENEIYTLQNRHMCEACAIRTELYPLEHTNTHGHKISEPGSRLNRVIDNILN